VARALATLLGFCSGWVMGQRAQVGFLHLLRRYSKSTQRAQQTMQPPSLSRARLHTHHPCNLSNAHAHSGGSLHPQPPVLSITKAQTRHLKQQDVQIQSRNHPHKMPQDNLPACMRYQPPAQQHWRKHPPTRARTRGQSQWRARSAGEISRVLSKAWLEGFVRLWRNWPWLRQVPATQATSCANPGLGG